MRFRRFNGEGIEAFRRYLHRLRQDPYLAPPLELLHDEGVSEALEPPIQAAPIQFQSRLAFARWLYEISGEDESRIPRTDPGFWAWLSLALFDQVAPADSRGRRKPGADARHIPDASNWRRRYRHLLANPYDVFMLHRDNPARAFVALVNPLHKPGELTEQFTGRVDIVTCPGTMALASYLYVDPRTGRPKKGASGKAARRFGKLMNQYTRTFDLPAIRPETFAGLLPAEFDRFKPS